LHDQSIAKAFFRRMEPAVESQGKSGNPPWKIRESQGKHTRPGKVQKKTALATAGQRRLVLPTGLAPVVATVNGYRIALYSNRTLSRYS
jgi:hypothetical protein